MGENTISCIVEAHQSETLPSYGKPYGVMQLFDFYLLTTHDMCSNSARFSKDALFNSYIQSVFVLPAFLHSDWPKSRPKRAVSFGLMF